MRRNFFFCAALLSSLLCGFSGCLAIFSAFYEIQLGIKTPGWIVISALLAAGACSFLFFTTEQKTAPPGAEIRENPEFEKFMKECKLAIRGHLKLSVIFWILAYRKEKVKSFEDARKELFQEIRREIPSVRWMDAIIEEIREELRRVP